jgi:hypothetical protein
MSVMSAEGLEDRKLVVLLTVAVKRNYQLVGAVMFAHSGQILGKKKSSSTARTWQRAQELRTIL